MHADSSTDHRPAGPHILRIDARAACDALGTISPGPAISCLLDVTPDLLAQWTHIPRARFRVLAIDRPDLIDHHPLAAGAYRVDRRETVLMPGLVNAHTHLDLTHIGPVAPAGSPGEILRVFIDRVRAARATSVEGIAASVRLGIERSLAGGVVLVGDIAGAPRGVPSLVPYETLVASPLMGVSFLEFFAIGSAVPASLQRLGATIAGAVQASHGSGVQNPGVALGLQPHAPYSVAIAGYRAALDLAARHGLPLCTHLAESPEEAEFVAHARGPQRALLESLSLWNTEIASELGKGLTPIAHLAPVLQAGLTLAVHVNQATDEDLRLLTEAGVTVAYCARASDYFRAHESLGPHRYRAMRAAGMRVVLGTDSILNLPVDPEAPRMSTLDDMRFLFARDGVRPADLLAMATTEAAEALGYAAKAFTLRPGAELGGVIAIPLLPDVSVEDSARAVLQSSSSPELLLVGKVSRSTAINPIPLRP